MGFSNAMDEKSERPTAAAPIPEAKLLALQEENQRLKRALEELSFLNDLARAIGASTNLQEIMQTIVHRALRAIHAEQGVITLVEGKGGDPTRTLIRDMASTGAQQLFRPNESLLGWMHHHKMPLLLNHPGEDPRFRGVQWDKAVVSLVCVPLIVKSELKGVLTVYNKKAGSAFTDEDQRLLAIIAAQSAQVIENARLSEEEQTLLRMQEQIRLATKIQADLLPKTAPQIAGYDIAGKTRPAQSIGGDYFDFIPIDEQRLALCLGDVSGKGLPASLLMANLQATIRGQTLSDSSAGECLKRANTLLLRSTDDEKFATLFYAILDTSQHRLQYSNAGHNDPFIFSPSGAAPKRLQTGGIMLGMLSDLTFKDDAMTLQENDLLLIYSDGVTEAIDKNGEDFGEARLHDLVLKNLSLPASELVDQIIQAVKTHAGSSPPREDDITVVVVKRASRNYGKPGRD
jgi:sigma-B regulation protein RsbU (phosphoserine phosphatase)